MTETYLNFNVNNILNMCCVCFKTGFIRPMWAEEENWYRSFVLSMSHNVQTTLKICVYCGHILKKLRRFSAQCRDAYMFLSEVITSHQEKKSLYPPQTFVYNLITTKTNNDDFVPNENDLQIEINDLKMESFDETLSEGAVCDDDNDDLPLVLLSAGINGCKVKKKRKKYKSALTELLKKSQSDGKNKRSFKKLKEGFTSRMVQETEEYTVIKLSREQVLDEMRIQGESDKYLRSLYKCELCVKGFNFEDVLRTHMMKHSKGRGMFKCDMCSQYCPSAVSLRGHIKSHTTRYSCKVCGCVRLSRQHLLEHYSLTHSAAAATYSCDHCTFTTNKRTVIQRHVRGHRSSERLTCERCDRHFSNKESLRVHTARHDKSKSLQCPECPRRFIYPALLQRHIQAVHVRRDYYCVECDIPFKSPDNLRLHFKKAKKHRESSAYTDSCPPLVPRGSAIVKGKKAKNDTEQDKECTAKMEVQD